MNIFHKIWIFVAVVTFTNFYALEKRFTCKLITGNPNICVTLYPGS